MIRTWAVTLEGELMEFESAKSAERHFGLSKNVVLRKAKSNTDGFHRRARIKVLFFTKKPNALAALMMVRKGTLPVLTKYEKPISNREKYRIDSEYREYVKEASKKYYDKMKDDPVFKARRAEASRKWKARNKQTKKTV